MTEQRTFSFRGETVTVDTSTVPEPVVEPIFTAELYGAERESLAVLLSELRSDDVFFDIGAMYGLYTGLAAGTLTEGSVVAFEPYPRNLEALERTVELSGSSNVDIRDIALSDTNGRQAFESPSLEYHVEQLEALRAQHPETPMDPEKVSEPDKETSFVTFTAETRAGDDLVESGELPQPNVVKIDVEGAEAAVVDGLRDALAREECRLLVCEIHPPVDEREDPGQYNSERSVADYGSTVDTLVREVQGLGFETELDHGEGYIHLRGTKQSA